ncbi:G-type lectin S-receptor-like serine/threonine-protein kinase At1g61370 [Eucalyptus grandis]|uniref:G-type lectin S-receptor-like serine/threonine-protein kinase At1g61370 n=1 Tax=Eucalyptus grandis TaxID=71139 RepID=UPI00192EC91E|nr:G-type lectin S-receptor-like serine/threonine-protein kinase At1g61370 [Eucalyptus grandis]
MTSERPPQLFTWNGLSPYWRSGQWDNTRFIGIPAMDSTYFDVRIPTMDNTYFDARQNIVRGPSYYTSNNHNNSFFGYTFISSEGTLKGVLWANSGWLTYWKAPAPTNPCEIYGKCGPFGVCNNISSPICRCLEGFKPISDEEWNRGNWTRGCLRELELNCQKSASTAASTTVKKDRFWKITQMKLPDSADYSLINDAERCQSWWKRSADTSAGADAGVVADTG